MDRPILDLVADWERHNHGCSSRSVSPFGNHDPESACRDFAVKESYVDEVGEELVENALQAVPSLPRIQGIGESRGDCAEQSLLPCPHCRRIFLPDRLAVHLKCCRQARTKSSPVGSPQRKQRAPGKPKEVDTRGSLLQTPEKRRNRDYQQTPMKSRSSPRLQASFAESHASSRNCPTSPAVQPKLRAREAARWPAAAERPLFVSRSESTIQSQLRDQHVHAVAACQESELHGATWYSQAEPGNEEDTDRIEEDLVPCPHCRRTFLPDRLDVHLRGCQSHSPYKSLAKIAGSANLHRDKTGAIQTRSTPNLQRNAWQ